MDAGSLRMLRTTFLTLNLQVSIHDVLSRSRITLYQWLNWTVENLAVVPADTSTKETRGKEIGCASMTGSYHEASEDCSMAQELRGSTLAAQL